MNGHGGDIVRRFTPFLLIVAVIGAGVYLLHQRGMIQLPAFFKKTVVVVKPPAVIDILFGGNEYTLSYAATDSTHAVSIATFAKDEQWKGTAGIEPDEDAVHGHVLSLTDKDRAGTKAYLFKPLNLANIDLIKLTVFLNTIPDDVESLTLLFANADGTKYYRFPVTNLVPGINYLTISKHRFFLTDGGSDLSTKTATQAGEGRGGFGWDDIQRLQIELYARPTAKANVDIGWIRGEKEDLFTPEWNWDGEEHFFNVDTGFGGKPTLLMRHIGRGVGILKKVGSVKDFTFDAKFLPLHKGTIGLFARGEYKTGMGYYLAMGGLGTSDWTISKYHLEEGQPKTTVLLAGQISNFEFTSEQPFWLRMIADGTKISGHFSLDGKDYTKLGEVSDAQYRAGGIGIATAAGAAGYVDELHLVQKK